MIPQKSWKRFQGFCIMTLSAGFLTVSSPLMIHASHTSNNWEIQYRKCTQDNIVDKSLGRNMYGIFPFISALIPFLHSTPLCACHTHEQHTLPQHSSHTHTPNTHMDSNQVLLVTQFTWQRKTFHPINLNFSFDDFKITTLVYLFVLLNVNGFLSFFIGVEPQYPILVSRYRNILCKCINPSTMDVQEVNIQFLKD